MGWDFDRLLFFCIKALKEYQNGILIGMEKDEKEKEHTSYAKDKKSNVNEF